MPGWVCGARVVGCGRPDRQSPWRVHQHHARNGQNSRISQAISDPIQDAANSPGPDRRLEGQTAQELRNARINVNSFQKQIGINGSVGEIDIETDVTIIEVTNASARKGQQIDKLINDPQMNPSGKAVILYAPNYGQAAGQSVIGLGAHIARSPAELVNLVRRLGG